MTRHLLGIDAGSSVTKAAIFDEAGRQIAVGTRRVRVERPRAGWVELDPATAWQATVEAIREALAASRLSALDIAAVGLSGAMVGLWAIDAAGRALRPGINWEDSRAQALIDGLRVGRPDFHATIFRSSGSVMQQGCTLPLLAWLRRHEPAVFQAAKHVFSYKDYLRFRLTGDVAADRTEAAVAPGSALARDRSAAMLDLFGLADAAAKLPPVLDSEALGGVVTEVAAAETGLAAGTPVAVGAGDVPAGVIGAGALGSGTGVVILGTTCIVGFVTAGPLFTPPDLGLLFSLPGPAWFRAMVNVAGTLNLDWAVRTLAPDLADAPDLYGRLEAMVSAVPIGAEGVTFVPYLSESGIIAPRVSTEARAGFFGLAPRHGRPEMFRAVYEGVALAVRDLIEISGFDGASVILTGGGARSTVWPQMIADAIGRPVLVPAATELGARGAALLAGTAIGLYPTVIEASIGTRDLRLTVAPDLAAAGPWNDAFALYRTRRDRILP